MAKSKPAGDSIQWPVFLMLTKPSDMKGSATLRSLISHLEQTEHGAGSQGHREPTFDVASRYVELTVAQQDAMAVMFGETPKDWRAAAVGTLLAAVDLLPPDANSLRRVISTFAAQVRTWTPAAPLTGPVYNPDPDRIAARPYAVVGRREVNTSVGRVLSDSEKGEVQEV